MNRSFRVIIATAVLWSLSGPAQADLADGLVAYYPFDGDARDVSGSGHDGQLTGGATDPTLTRDRFGNPNKAYFFDGIDDYIKTPIEDLPRDAISIVYWFKGAVLLSAVREQHPHRTGDYIVSGWLGLHILSCESQGVSVDGNGGNSATDGNWHHIAMTWDKKGYFTSYFDGAKVDQFPSSGRSVPIFYANAFIGSWVESDIWGTEFNPKECENTEGKLDDIRIYNRALSESEISTLFDPIPYFDADNDSDIDQDDATFFASRYGRKHGDVVAHYPFDGNADDVSGNGHHGTVHGTTSFAAGSIDGAVQFHNAGHASPFVYRDYIELPPMTLIDPFSVSLRVKFHSNAHSHAGSVYSLGDNWPGNDYFILFITPGGDLYVGIKNCGEDTCATGHVANLRDDAWHLIQVSFRDRIDVYVDNVLRYSQPSFSISFLNAPQYVALHTWANNAHRASRFNGLVDELKIRTLHQSNIDPDHDGDIDGTDLALFAESYGSNDGRILRFWDDDEDGYGDPDRGEYFWPSEPMAGYVTNGDDCDDNNRLFYMGKPGQPGVCDFSGYTDCTDPFAQRCHLPVSNVEAKLASLEGVDVSKDELEWSDGYIDPGEYPGTKHRHMQSIQYVNIDGAHHIVTTMGGERNWDHSSNITLVKPGRVGSEGGQRDKTVGQYGLYGNELVTQYDHAGGAQAIGNYLFVALENAKKTEPAQIGVWSVSAMKYKYGIPIQPSTRPLNDDENPNVHTSVGVTKMMDGTYLIAASVFKGSDTIQFYKSTGRSLTSNPGFQFVYQWEKVELISPAGVDNWPDCSPQNINLVVERDTGDIYLVMFGIEAAHDLGTVPCLSGQHDDHIYVFKVDMNADNKITLEFRRKVDIKTGDTCDCVKLIGVPPWLEACTCGWPGCYVPMGASGTNFEAGGGLWIAPYEEDRIAILAIEHWDSCGGRTRWGVTENWDDFER